MRYLFAVVEWDWTKTRRRKSADGRDAHAQGGWYGQRLKRAAWRISSDILAFSDGRALHSS